MTHDVSLALEASREASLDLQSLDEKADHIAMLVMNGEISEEEAHEIEDKLIRAQERLAEKDFM